MSFDSRCLCLFSAFNPQPWAMQLQCVLTGWRTKFNTNELFFCLTFPFRPLCHLYSREREREKRNSFSVSAKLDDLDYLHLGKKKKIRGENVHSYRPILGSDELPFFFFLPKKHLSNIPHLQFRRDLAKAEWYLLLYQPPSVCLVKVI